jgi:hypothetical protein
MDEINLQSFNLIVGKNAVGKSRILSVPSAFASMINQSSSVYYRGSWELTFITDDKQKIDYNLINIPFKRVVKESILVDGKPVLERDRNVTKLYSHTKQDTDEISPPDDKLVLHVRRDKKEYPFLEHIVEWAEKTHTFKFAQVNPNASGDKIEEPPIIIEDIPALIDELTDTSKMDIINEFNELGYEIENFYARKQFGRHVLYVREKKLTYDLRQSSLSQGMFRAISLIAFIHYLIDNHKAKTIIVDDLCEGLDYERATKLGSLIFEKFRDKGVQFIVSSNDCFLMDVIPVRYWTVLSKENSHISVYNYENSKKKFDDFKYSGLSNFDLFASDYLD